MERVVTHGSMLGFRIKIIEGGKFWGFRRGVKNTNIVSRGNRNFSWKRIRSISGFFSGGYYHHWEWEGDSKLG